MNLQLHLKQKERERKKTERKEEKERGKKRGKKTNNCKEPSFKNPSKGSVIYIHVIATYNTKFLTLLSFSNRSQAILPSIRVFSNELALRIRWPKYQRLNFSPSNEYSGLISFRIDWFDLLVVQRTLNNTIQKHQSFSTQLSLWSNSHIHT